MDNLFHKNIRYLFRIRKKTCNFAEKEQITELKQ